MGFFTFPVVMQQECGRNTAGPHSCGAQSPHFFPLLRLAGCDMVSPMTTLDEIETAAAALSDAEKQHLLMFLAVRLQAHGAPLPETPLLSREKINDWMAEDEAAMRRLHPGPQG